VRQLGDEFPRSLTESVVLRVQVEVPLIARQAELVSGGGGIGRRRIDGRVGDGAAAVLGGLERVNAGQQRSTAAGGLELYRDRAARFEALHRTGKAAASRVRTADRREETSEVQRRTCDAEVAGADVTARVGRDRRDRRRADGEARAGRPTETDDGPGAVV